MNFIFIITLLLASIHSAFAEDPKNFRFGVLSYRPKEVTIKQWQPLAQELQKALPNHTVELLAMTHSELDKAAREQQLDFVLTNPEHFIFLKNKLAMNAVATLIKLENGHLMTQFAGVIFTRADRNDIQKLADLNGKSIASPAQESLGGYLMQRWELEKINVAAKKYYFLGLPHDKSVEAVLTGKADAGFVRSGVLEELEREGKISLGENPTIRVLAPHTGINMEKFPLLYSTEHYPEWSFSVGQHISPEIVRKVSLTLLNIQLNSDIAKAAGIAGFNPPADYTSVEVLMLRLRSHPEELKYFNFSDVAWRYRAFFVMSVAVALLILMLVFFLIHANRRFKKVANENQKLLLAVEQSPVSIVITDLNADIEYVNHHFLETTGYSLNEVIGKKTRLFKSGKVDSLIYEEIWAALTSGKQWRGEMINLRKDGSEYIVLSLITPVRQTNGHITHYLNIEQDITERKKTEEQITKLAFHDPLTGLANRRRLLNHLQYSIATSHREQWLFAILLMDLDKFKPVNDTLGHAAGDELLQQVSERLTQCLRDSDLVARLGGDEFVLVLGNLHKPEDAAQVALKVIDDLTLPFELSKGHRVQVGASIGISFYPQHGDTPEKLMDNADTALYQAKDNGRGRFDYYQG